MEIIILSLIKVFFEKIFEVRRVSTTVVPQGIRKLKENPQW